MKVISLTIYDLDDAIRMLKDIQSIIREEYTASLELGYDCYLIKIYRNE